VRPSLLVIAVNRSGQKFWQGFERKPGQDQATRTFPGGNLVDNRTGVKLAFFAKGRFYASEKCPGVPKCRIYTGWRIQCLRHRNGKARQQMLLGTHGNL
jgi:hypothetical protein